MTSIDLTDRKGVERNINTELIISAQEKYQPTAAGLVPASGEIPKGSYSIIVEVKFSPAAGYYSNTLKFSQEEGQKLKPLIGSRYQELYSLTRSD
jgi:hypothetical protein